MYKQIPTPLVHAGLNSISQLSGMLSVQKKKCIGIITDRGIVESGVLEILLQYIPQDAEYTIDDSVESDPSSESVERVTEEIRNRRKADIIIGVGGGSSLDTAKIVSVLLEQGGAIKDIASPEAIFSRLPLILVPTTAGTGSEATPNAIVVSEGAKLGIISAVMMPDAAILDPGLTRSLPKEITANTGIDALSHAVESYLSRNANNMSEAYSLSAVRLIAESLESAYLQPDDMAAREKMLTASFLAGLALSGAGTIAVHALGYALGVRYHIPHGNANSIVFLPVLEACRDGIQDKLAVLSETVGLGRNGDFISWLREKMGRLGISLNLSAYGAVSSDQTALTNAALRVDRLLKNNPVPFGEDKISSVFSKLIEDSYE